CEVTLHSAERESSFSGIPAFAYQGMACLFVMPRDLMEAATIDGAGHLRAFRLIQLPLALPAISSPGILTFLVT
ncbi:MAG: ABC transporter permease subunit, partial [Bifidobacterium dentium]